MRSIRRLFESPYVHVLIITVVGICVYANTLGSPFVFDDEGYILTNPAIKDFKYFADPSLVQDTSASRNVKENFRTRYLGYLSFALNYRLHGQDVRGFHTANIALHIANSVLVYLLVMFIFRSPFLLPVGDQGENRGLPGLIAFTASLLFVSHPVQTQAVTYITQRFTSLATFFYLSSILAYIRFRLVPGKASRYSSYGAALLLALFAMFTKEIAFTLPLTVIMLEFLFFEDNGGRALRLAPFMLTLLIIPLSLSGGGGMALSDHADTGDGIVGGRAQISGRSYLYTQFGVVLTYIRLLFLPVNQRLDYDHPIYSSFSDPHVYVPFLFLSTIAVIGVLLCIFSSRMGRAGRVGRLTATGIFWFFITLSVESSFIPLADVIFEHRVYLPSVGFFIALTSGTAVALWGRQGAGALAGRGFIIAVAAAVIVLSAATYSRNLVWQDPRKLWEDTAQKSPEKPRAHNNLGNTYFGDGLLDEAIREYQTALKLDPTLTEAYNNMGVVYADMGLKDEAIAKYVSAIRLNPSFANAHYNLANLYLSEGKTTEAIEEYLIAINIDPSMAEARNNLGLAYLGAGQQEEALREFGAAIGLKPDFAAAHYNMANELVRGGRLEESIGHYENALKYNPENPEAHHNLANVYFLLGRLDDAGRHYRAALSLDPDDPESRAALKRIDGRGK